MEAEAEEQARAAGARDPAAAVELEAQAAVAGEQEPVVAAAPVAEPAVAEDSVVERDRADLEAVDQVAVEDLAEDLDRAG